MSRTASPRKRVNITLPTDTLRLLDRLVPKGNRSRLIDEAVRSFLSDKSRSRLRELLGEGARARAVRDMGVAEAWFEAENEAWPGRKRAR